ncbi:MAG: acyl-CoA synthetase [Sciscionella sp.]
MVIDQLEQSRRLTLPAALGRSAQRGPDRPALVFHDATRTYHELSERTDRLARALVARGVGPGDRVAMLLHNRIEFVETFYACHKAGACAVPVNFRLVQDEVDYIFDDCEPVGVISDQELSAVARLAAERHRTVRFHLAVGDGGSDVEPYEAALVGAEQGPPAIELDGDMLAFVIYTSGTTGRPKGAMITHQNLVCNTMNWIYEIGPRESDVWLSGLPLFHIGGLNGVLPFLHLGATSVITASRGFDAGESIALVKQHGVTMCFFVPTQWADICAAPELEGLDVSQLRVAMWGAATAPRATLDRLTATFPNVQVVNAFGQTEMSSNTTFLKGADAVRKMGSIGRPVVNVAVRIVDADGRDVAPGTVGEIVYRGPTVMAGYLGKPEATAKAFAGGWFHSGDLVYEDDEGFLYIADRVDDMLISGGENVYPAEVEAAIITHSAVADVAVIGVPHPRWGETPVAIAVGAPGAIASEEDVIAHCRTRLASYKKPTRVIFVDALPRNATGKVLKRDLRMTYQGLFTSAAGA